MKQSIFVALLASLSLAACNKDDSSSSGSLPFERLEFGKYYGFSGQSKAFLMTGGRLYADSMVITPGGGRVYKNTPMPPAKYAMATQIQTQFPLYLRQHPDTIFACDFCVDQGAIWLTARQNGHTSYWNIELEQSVIPPTIYNYVQQTSSIIDQL